MHDSMFILGVVYLALFSCEKALLGSLGSVSEDLRSHVVLIPFGIDKPTLVISLTFLFGPRSDPVLRKRSFMVSFSPQACCYYFYSPR